MKLVYKPFGLLMSVIGGSAAATSFNRLWRLIDSEGQAPKATDQDSSWRQVVVASAMRRGGLRRCQGRDRPCRSNMVRLPHGDMARQGISQAEGVTAVALIQPRE
jgi:Protein of unknown function (DUF4235)